jgi:hypothetical protein
LDLNSGFWAGPGFALFGFLNDLLFLFARHFGAGKVNPWFRRFKDMLSPTVALLFCMAQLFQFGLEGLPVDSFLLAFRPGWRSPGRG